VAAHPASTREIADRPGAELSYRGLPLSSGQVIVSERGSASSLLVSLLTEEFHPFVHSGLVVIDEQKPFVYEAVGSFGPHLSGPPTDALKGHIRRVPLDKYLARHAFVAIYDPPATVDRAAAAAYARTQRQRRTPFDPYFDASDDRALYCTEFVAHALAAGGMEWVAASPVRDNHSLEVVRDWLKIRAPAIILAGSLVSDERRVALVSRRYSPAQMETYFALKSELHRRFTPDQKLGNVFARTGGGVKLRPAVAAFLRDGMEYAAAHPDEKPEDVAALVARLGTEYLGPLPAADAASAKLTANR
jgi:hypothetical protein